jgi:hypothetical protein
MPNLKIGNLATTTRPAAELSATDPGSGTRRGLVSKLSIKNYEVSAKRILTQLFGETEINESTGIVKLVPTDGSPGR